MAEEKLTPLAISSDDVNVLRVLMHNIQGISPISTTEFVAVPADEE